MKYLQPKFQFAVTDKRPEYSRFALMFEPKAIKKHRFAPVNGLCAVCVLDKIGHEKRWGKCS